MAESKDVLAFVGHAGETEPADVAAFEGEAVWTTPHMVHIDAVDAVNAQGRPLQQSMFTNYNDNYDLHVEGQSLVGRSAEDHGRVETIRVEAPLVIEEGTLRYDPEALNSLLQMIMQLSDALAANAEEDRKNRWIG